MTRDDVRVVTVGDVWESDTGNVWRVRAVGEASRTATVDRISRDFTRSNIPDDCGYVFSLDTFTLPSMRFLYRLGTAVTS